MKDINQKAEEIRDAIQGFLDERRQTDKDLCEEHDLTYQDPFADVRILVEDEWEDSLGVKFTGKRVRVTYDGAGYDYLSYRSVVENPYNGKLIHVGPENQDKINKLIAEVDPHLYLENENTWSFSVYIS